MRYWRWWKIEWKIIPIWELLCSRKIYFNLGEVQSKSEGKCELERITKKTLVTSTEPRLWMRRMSKFLCVFSPPLCAQPIFPLSASHTSFSPSPRSLSPRRWWYYRHSPMRRRVILFGVLTALFFSIYQQTCGTQKNLYESTGSLLRDIISCSFCSACEHLAVFFTAGLTLTFFDSFWLVLGLMIFS